MDDQPTVWLVVVNVVLGVIVILFCTLVVSGVVREFIGRARRRRAYRAELDRDLQSYFRNTHKC